MLAQIGTLKARARARLNWLTRGTDQLLTWLLRAWRWLNSVDIPLSPLQWILLFYIVLGLMYLAATPVFEANEELWHYGYIKHLRETNSLPIQKFDGRDSIYRQHGSQPPLYYALMALASAPFDSDDVDIRGRLNPHVSAHQPDSFGNKNLIIHDEGLSLLAGPGVAILFIRALGLTLGAGTIVFVFKIGELSRRSVSLSHSWRRLSPA